LKTRDELTAMSRGYWQARMLLTAVELGLFEALGRRRLTAATIAKRIGGEPRATGMFLGALAGQGLLRKRGGSYEIAPAMRSFLTEGSGSALGMLRHHERLWRTWDKLTDCVRSGKPAKSDTAFHQGPEAARAFTIAMRDGALRFAPGVAAELDLSGRRLLLDLGGGPGIYAAAFARANPGLIVRVVDLPDVVVVGEEMLAEHPDVLDRVSYVACDLEAEPLPGGADAAFLSHVIHGQDEEEMAGTFGRIAAALEPKGLLIVRDFFLESDGTRPAASALFSLNMLVNTPGGRSYTAKEVTVLLRDSGFRTVRYRRSKAVPDTGYLLART